MRAEQDAIGKVFASSYDRIFKELPVNPTICELGVNQGYSLSVWQAHFPASEIVGVDIQKTCIWPVGTHKVVCEQNDTKLPALVSEICPQGFDLIIDDASHEARKTRRSWELLWPLVKPDGFYVIEDWELGFPSSPLYYVFGGENVEMAKNFLDLLDAPGNQDIDGIEYKHGLIIFRKQKAPTEAGA